jgi:hypothetical protein
MKRSPTTATRDGLAQWYLTQARAYARHADDHALAAETLAAQAHQALYLARPDEAVDLARAAQAAAVRHGSATLLTECLVMEAHGHAARSARQALDLTVRLTSARSVRYVRDLVWTLRPRADVPAIRDFTAEVRKQLPAGWT